MASDSITNWVAAKEHHIAEKLRSLGIVYAKACQAPDQIAPSNACNGQETHSLSLNFPAASHVSDHLESLDPRIEYEQQIGLVSHTEIQEYHTIRSP